MSIKRLTACLLALTVCLTLLTGCKEQEPPAPLPGIPADLLDAAAPIGDAGLDHSAVCTLYLPSRDGQQLLALYEPMTLTYSRHPAESIVRALLAHPGDSRVRPLGGGVTLSLSGANPVEVSGGVCTVSLTASALQLSLPDLYTVSLALAATLCELDDVHYVNLLAAGAPVAMDVNGKLPLGSVTAQTGQELPVLWDQLNARRTPVGESPAGVPLTAAAPLYFPLPEGKGIAPETRRLTFAGQTPEQLAEGLIAALSAGPEVLDAAMPDLSAMLIAPPAVTQLESGGLRLTLHFPADVRSRIAAAGTDPACCFAALVTTLTTFVPSLQQVCILTGDTALTSVLSEPFGSLLFPGGLHHRQDYAAYLTAQTTIYGAGAGRLVPLAAALPYRTARDPRTLLLALAALPEEQAVLPAGLTDADILGLAIQGDTLLINLSERFAAVIRGSSMDQRLMVYSITGAMCSCLPVRRVAFFFGGRQAETLGGDVLWSGSFMHDPAMTNP